MLHNERAKPFLEVKKSEQKINNVANIIYILVFSLSLKIVRGGVNLFCIFIFEKNCWLALGDYFFWSLCFKETAI